MKSIKPNIIQLSLIIAIFVTVITNIAKFTLFYISKEYRLFGIYNMLPELNAVGDIGLVIIGIVTDFLIYLLVLLLGFRLIKKDVSLLHYSLLSIFGIIMVVVLFSETDQHSQMGNNYLLLALYYGVISILLIIIPLSYYSDNKNELITTKNDELHLENIALKYQSLKNKLEPHFLFNSLNVLDSLVDTNNALSHSYIGNLSQIYRYILQSNDYVTLKEALAFIKKYIEILTIRYECGLLVVQDIDDTYLDTYIAPLALQTLIENCVKHNKISKISPLKIEIFTNDMCEIVVRNNLQPMGFVTSGDGIGLANIVAIYRMKWSREITITSNETHFEVVMPLIK